MLAGTKALPLAVPGACSSQLCRSAARTFNMLFRFAGCVGLSKALMMESKLESERNKLSAFSVGLILPCLPQPC